MHTTLSIRTNGPGLYEFTKLMPALNGTGVVTLIVQHTSCSLLIQENADPDVQVDLDNFFKRLVPRTTDPSMSYLIHTYEGPDDMPAHIKASLLPTTLSVPFQDDKLCLGTWQGLYLFEHRDRPMTRRIVVAPQ